MKFIAIFQIFCNIVNLIMKIATYNYDIIILIVS